MEEIWVLAICYGISWAGCGGAHNIEYASEESCYKALNAMVVDADEVLQAMCDKVFRVKGVTDIQAKHYAVALKKLEAKAKAG